MASTYRPAARPKATILKLVDIPSLTALYAKGELSPIDPSAAQQPAYAPNARLNARIALVSHDITRMQVDGIVNAANTSLLGGGGVDGAIHRGAGYRLLEACLPLNGCQTGDAKMTDGFDLPARKIIHTVGPQYERERDKSKAADMLRSCYRKSLELGERHGLKSLVFCPISTNIYRYPNVEAADVAISEVRKYFHEGRGGNYNMIVFTNILDVDYKPYLDLLPKYFPPEPKKELVKAEEAEAVGKDEKKDSERAEKTEKKEDKKETKKAEESKAGAIDDDWVEVDGSEIPKKASVEDDVEEK